MLFISFLMLFALQTTESSMSFIEMAKNNPRAFVDLVDTADPVAVKAIIAIIEGMINDVKTRTEGLTADLKAAEDALKTSELDDENQGKKCVAIGVNMTEKKKLWTQRKVCITQTRTVMIPEYPS